MREEPKSFFDRSIGKKVRYINFISDKETPSAATQIAACNTAEEVNAVLNDALAKYKNASRATREKWKAIAQARKDVIFSERFRSTIMGTK